MASEKIPSVELRMKQYSSCNARTCARCCALSTTLANTIITVNVQYKCLIIQTKYKQYQYYKYLVLHIFTHNEGIKRAFSFAQYSRTKKLRNIPELVQENKNFLIYMKKRKLQIPEVPQYKPELTCHPEKNLRKFKEIQICMKKFKAFGQ